MDSIGSGPFVSMVLSYAFNALTCIDPVTNLLEIARQNTKTSAETADLFENNWLSRYPRPSQCIHDNGPEFQGH